MKPTDLPVHPIYVTAVGLASDVPIISSHGLKIDCLINDYLSRDKIVEIPVTIFHPLESRLKNQTTNIRRGSSLFFSGEITLVDNKLYLELHNFSFLKGQNQVPSKSTSLPWLNTTTSKSSATQINNARLIHQEQPESTKRNIQNPFQPNKIIKLADIATNILDGRNEDNEKTNDQINNDKLSESDSDVAQYNEMNEMVIENLKIFFSITYFLKNNIN
jgi:hypothetical protein